MSEHDVDMADIDDLRTIPFVGEVCIDMVRQARAGVNVREVIDLVKTSDEELEAKIFGEPGPKDVAIKDDDEMVDLNAYVEEQMVDHTPKVESSVSDDLLKDLKEKGWSYNSTSNKFTVQMELPERHVDWVCRLSDWFTDSNPENLAHMCTVPMILRKFVLNARGQDPTDAGRRVNSRTMQDISNFQ